MTELAIWHANDQSAADWFATGCNTDATFSSAFTFTSQVIPAAGSASFLRISESFQRLLRLDKPDLVVTREIGSLAVPLLSVEITASTPHGQHGKQRFARLAAAAELGIPPVYIIPYSKQAKVKGKLHTYNLGPSVPFGLRRLGELTGCPAACFGFPTTSGKLRFDPNFPSHPDHAAIEMGECFAFVRSVLGRSVRGDRPTYDDHDPVIAAAMKAVAAAAQPAQIGEFSTLTLVKTSALDGYITSHTSMTSSWVKRTLAGLPKRVMQREYSLFFQPDGRMFEKAGDPYCGMFAWFDFAFCRSGPTPEEREINLIYFPTKAGKARSISPDFANKGYRRYWQYTSSLRLTRPLRLEEQFQISHELRFGGIYRMNKPLRVFGYLADLIVFDDAMLAF
jgi:hypothetical protein